MQSLFGTGLLVFGTPTFLLLGYSFESTLISVLPASLIISLFQVRHGKEKLQNFKKEFFIFTLPPLTAFLILVLLSGESYSIKIPIGSMLLLFSAIRMSKRQSEALVSTFHRYRQSFLMIMGAVHGATNMGGALLNIYVNGLYHTKEEARVHIAYGYTIFMVVQLITIFLIIPTLWTKIDISLFLTLPAIAGCTYLFLGNKIFQRTNDVLYYHLMTAMMVVLGIVLLIS